jgi:hypothetical protein
VRIRLALRAWYRARSMAVSPPERILAQAREFAQAFSAAKHPELLGKTDGKRVGTYIEASFKRDPREIRIIESAEGNSSEWQPAD